MPQAPSPSASPSQVTEESEYVVFAPKPSSIEQVRGGSWGWDEEAAVEQQVPDWNPRTGFMGSAAEREARMASGSTAGTSEAKSGPAPAAVEVKALLFTAPVEGDAPLPAVSKDQVLSSCLGTGFWMTALALFLRQYAQLNAPQILGTDPRLLADVLRLPSGIESWENLGLTMGAVGAVTAARLALMSTWPDFRSGTNRSNKQVLEPLGWFDIMLVAAVSGASEELLFRGAVIPASFPDWRGAVLSGLVFGVLHNSGGRNPAFAAWASAVGMLYGGLFVYTHNIWVPITAHALANFCSAAAWKARQSD